MKENEYQAKLIGKLKRRFKGCVILKNDASYIQGIPDLIVLYNDMWALLEVKRSQKAFFSSAKTPEGRNQEYYISKLGQMSFAAFIFPENEQETLDALQRAFESYRKARLSQRKQVQLAPIR
jgi:hypothetical protein